MKISFHNLGCKVNSYELEGITQLAAKEGFEIVPFSEPADVCVINTCSVTNIADRKSRQMIHKARKHNPGAIIVATGCYAQLFAEELEKEGCADIVVPNENKKDIITLVKEYAARTEGQGDGSICLAISGIRTASGMLSTPSLGGNGHIVEPSPCPVKTRAYIKIEDGCNNFCSYCIIPYARGRVRSRDLRDILMEAQSLAAAGYKEIVLTGINLSAYENESLTRAPMDHKIHLIDVAEELSKIEGVERIRFSSLEPVIITEEFLDRLSALPKVCPHFHLSLQSGCDSVLSRMNRRYTAAEYLDRCNLIRKYYDHPAITTDIIVGFPGETEEEYQATVDFVKQCDIYEVHIFKYSRRKGTPADRMDGQLTDAVKHRRSNGLAEVVKENKNRFMEFYFGRDVQALMEERITVDGRDYYTGLTPEYVRIAVPAGERKLDNTFYTGNVKGFLGEDMLLADMGENG